MFKRLLVTLLPFLASSCRDESKSGEIRMISPKDILFSLPTLCDPAPAVDNLPAPSGARPLHEDDWRQIEFVPAANSDYIRDELATLTAFKKEHRRASGWTKIYLRKEHPTPLSELALQYTDLPMLRTSAVTLSGHPVRGGFALSDGSGWSIYGQKTPQGTILELGVAPSQSRPSEQFARDLAKIAQTSHVLLVDWYAGSLVDTTSTEAILGWGNRDR
jgi:hypothetical protein